MSREQTASGPNRGLAVERRRRMGLALLVALAAALAASPRAAVGQEAAAPAPPAVAIPNARQPAPDLLTGGQPGPEHLVELAAVGYRTLVDLRAPGERDWDEAGAAAAAGLRYVSIPVDGAVGLTEANVAALAAVLADREARPLVVHCASGNRVGALLALEAFARGESAQESLDLGLAAGLVGLEPVVRQRLGLAEEGDPPAPAEGETPGEGTAALAEVSQHRGGRFR